MRMKWTSGIDDRLRSLRLSGMSLMEIVRAFGGAATPSAVQHRLRHLGLSKSPAEACRARAKHGMFGTPEYTAWISMRRRCSQPHRGAWEHYGGRGIRVCDRWQTSFDAFFADMGRKPSPQHSIDRVDPNGHYEPSNCRWATPLEQARNRRSNRVVTYRGNNMSLAAALSAAGHVVEKNTARRRLELGWDVSEAVETPPGRAARTQRNAAAMR